MYIDQNNYVEICRNIAAKNALLVAVSKTKPIEAIKELYDTAGHRDFGENYVQELVEKQAQLPNDIRWHFIGHLQSNKIKYIAPFVHLIHGIDSLKLLKEVNKQALKNNRTINVLLQVHIAREETKFGLDENELDQIIVALASSEKNELNNILIQGFMGMASFSKDQEIIRAEFRHLKQLFNKYSGNQSQNFKPQILSMGMSGDYKIALEEGSTMIRIGSSIFGSR